MGFQLPTSLNWFSLIRRISGCHQTLGRWKHSLKPFTFYLVFPIGSMYGIFTYIWFKFMANVGKYTIHGSYRFRYMAIWQNFWSRLRWKEVWVPKNLEKIDGDTDTRLSEMVFVGFQPSSIVTRSSEKSRRSRRTMGKLRWFLTHLLTNLNDMGWHLKLRETLANLLTKNQWFSDAPCCQVHTYLTVSQNKQLL